MPKIMNKIGICGLALVMGASLSAGLSNIIVPKVNASKKENSSTILRNRINKSVRGTERTALKNQKNKSIKVKLLYNQLKHLGFNRVHAIALLAIMNQESSLDGSKKNDLGDNGYGYFQIIGSKNKIENFAKEDQTSIYNIKPQLQVLNSFKLQDFRNKQGSSNTLARYAVSHILYNRLDKKSDSILQRQIKYIYSALLSNAYKTKEIQVAKKMLGYQYSLKDVELNAQKAALGHKASVDAPSFVWTVLKRSGYSVPKETWNAQNMHRYMVHINKPNTKRGMIGVDKHVNHSFILLEHYHGKNTKILESGGVKGERVNISTIRTALGNHPFLVFYNPIEK